MTDKPPAPRPDPNRFKKRTPTPATGGRPAASTSPAGPAPARAEGRPQPANTGGGDPRQPSAIRTEDPAPTAWAAGPLHALVTVAQDRVTAEPSANALIMLRRVALRDSESPLRPEEARALFTWATKYSLGMGSDPALFKAVRDRRRAAMDASGRPYAQLVARPEWRMIVGSGERANPHEIGIALHGTTGWPIIPGSSLKGLAAAWAREESVDPVRYQRIFGHPIDPAFLLDDQPQGKASFYDALPCQPLTIRLDVVNPHFQSEWTNPVPSHFLTVSSGSFEFFVAGDDQDDCDEALEWCRQGMRDMGVGAKTGAGYGYLTGVPR